MREDSGFDSQAHVALLERQRQAFADVGRRLDYLVKWNPRDSAKADRDTWLAVAADHWQEIRPGKRQALWTQTVLIRDDKTEYVVKRYQAHATHEQFHSEIKTDLDLERLPSGKFATNALILHLAQLSYNILRLMGQLGLSPVRHPAKRRRLQELVHRAALVIHKARQILLDFGQDIGRMTVLNTLRTRLRYPRRSPC